MARKAGSVLLAPSLAEEHLDGGSSQHSYGGSSQLWHGAMAGSLILVPFYMCVLGLMCCGSVADSRAVFFRARYEASVADEFGFDEPQTFTMQDHFNFLKERELARRGRSDARTGILGTSLLQHVDAEEDEEDLIIVSDYPTEPNNIHDNQGR